jgi:glycogen debranching enzyme
MHTVDLTNPDFMNDDGSMIERGSIQIQRKKFLWKKISYNNIKLCNFALKPVRFKLTFFFEADFKDIFEVRGMSRIYKGKNFDPVVKDNELLFSYTGADNINRRTRIKFTPSPALLTAEKADFQFHLDPRKCMDLYIQIAFEEDEDKPEILSTDIAYLEMISRMTNIKNSGPKIKTSNDQFNGWLSRSQSDLFTLTTEMETGIYPYAGIPWYNTPFGRDGIITAMQTLWIFPDFSKYVLKYLAKTQAKEHNDLGDAEPGKIFHEQRNGEMANTGEIPFRMYYGSIDSTPLFIMLASMYYERTEDINFIREIWSNIEAALHWIDNYGDIDGDGFLEYRRKQESGLANQGWKDSWDSIFHEDGTLAEKPIALCEVQGYAYAAKLGAAKFYKLFGNDQKAEELTHQAETLKENFTKAFWSEEKQTYVIALDGNKRQCNVISSNAGHCLFTGIAKMKDAKKVARSLLSNRMFSGWGIRTVAKQEIRYNPMSYHNGSVWPHDNAIIAMGFAKYGLMEEAKLLTNSIFDVSLQFDSQRLPELFCGFDRIKNVSITNYPVACSPQAWSAGCAYLFIQACLNISIKPGEKTIHFHRSVLPASINELMLINFPFINERVTIHLTRIDGNIKAEIISPENNKINCVVNIL